MGSGSFLLRKPRFFQQKVRGCQALRVALRTVPATQAPGTSPPGALGGGAGGGQTGTVVTTATNPSSHNIVGSARNYGLRLWCVLNIEPWSSHT